MMRNYSKGIETQFFRVFYDIKDTNIIDQIIAVIDNTYENTIQMFDLKKDNYKFTLYICPDVQSFKTLTGKSDDEYKEWMVGNADYTKISLLRSLCLCIIKKYGADAYKRIYTQEDSLDKYLYEGFEKDAIRSLLSECNK